MGIILFDILETRLNLLPLTYTRPIADCRVGILTISQKWEHYFKQPISFLTEDYLSKKFSLKMESDNIFINGSLLPSADLMKEISLLQNNEKLVQQEQVLAFRTTNSSLTFENFQQEITHFRDLNCDAKISLVTKPADIFVKNGEEISADFELITKDRISQPLSDSNQVVGDKNKIFLEEGAVIECAILNTKNGYIYIGKDAEIMEGSIIRAPFALCEHAGVKMGAKIYGPTTIGPHCKVGGEVSNSVFFAFSNKGHDGFVGNSVVGEWCNLGADTNTSNLKNNYGDVDVWNYRAEKYQDTGTQFHGLIMGDHAKAGINTMFNTGTVVGVSANIFGGDFPPKFIPSFTWGGAAWLRTFIFDKGLEVATKMMERRGIALSEDDISILKEVYNRDEKFRKQK